MSPEQPSKAHTYEFSRARSEKRPSPRQVRQEKLHLPLRLAVVILPLLVLNGTLIKDCKYREIKTCKSGTEFRQISYEQAPCDQRQHSLDFDKKKTNTVIFLCVLSSAYNVTCSESQQLTQRLLDWIG